MRDLMLVGAGRVGRAFLDFWNDREIIIVDPYVLMEDFLGYAMTDDILDSVAHTAIIAVPGKIAPRKIIQCFQAGMNVVDISFHNEDVEEFGKIAEDNGVWYIPDAGFGPGIMNMMVRRLSMANPNATHINAYVGGLPMIRKEPWFYGSTWNIADHLAEYTRPARYIDKGRIKTVMPLESGIQYRNTPFGTMEAFCSDGLRTLLRKPDAPHVAEYTLRWPGFIKNMQLMYQSGMLCSNTIDAFILGIKQSGAWKFGKDEQDLSALIVEVNSGYRGLTGLHMFHTRPRQFKHSSMSWCTAVGAAAATHMCNTLEKITPGLHTIENMVSESENWAAYNRILKRGGLEINEF